MIKIAGRGGPSFFNEMNQLQNPTKHIKDIPLHELAIRHLD